jgi:HlyD family secretion protein
MDTNVLEAQRRQAEAQLQQANSAVATAVSQIAQRQSDWAAAQAVEVQRQAELKSARSHLARSMALADKGFLSPQAVDDEQARVESAEAAVAAARAQVVAAESAIASARSQVTGAQSSAAAAQANIECIQADIDDAVLKSPRDGRVQYIVARSAEVIPVGGRVLSLVDLTDVYMTFFLPTAVAGRVALGTEVRIVLDAAPGYVIPANVSFVADVAQFTPKTVETASEREKMMFRVRAQIPQALLRKYILRVKTGLPGVAYVLNDPNAAWPDHLQVKLPQ